MSEQAKLLTRRAGHEARQTARRASPMLVGLGRLGFLSKGIVYLVIGVLAIQVAIGRGGAMTDNRGALATISHAPLGRFLLIAVGIGIAGYTLWCFLQALFDTDNKGTDAKGVAARLGFAGNGAVYLLLAFSALRLLQSGNAGASSDTSAKSWTAQLLSKPNGQWLVALAGLTVIGVGIFQLFRAATANFREELRLQKTSVTTERAVILLGRIGYAAQGIIFALIGLFLLLAAWQANPGEARGLDGALAELAARPSGPWLLGLVSAGFVAHGLFLLAMARYRRMVIT